MIGMRRWVGVIGRDDIPIYVCGTSHRRRAGIEPAETIIKPEMNAAEAVFIIFLVAPFEPPRV
jgi:hypothetical protein